MLNQPYLANRKQRQRELATSNHVDYHVFPNAVHWQIRAERASQALIAAIGQDTYDAWYEAMPNPANWMEMALACENKLAESQTVVVEG